MPRTAFALDVEPNDDASAAEPISSAVFALGMLDASSDPADVFTFTASGDGALTARLSNYDIHNNDFALELWDADEVVLETADDDGVGGLRLDSTLEEGQVYFLVVHADAGAGRYHLWTTTERDAPTLTALSSSDPDPGDSFDRMLVSFAGDTSDAMGTDTLDDAASTVPALVGWTRVGLSPQTNTWQVELDGDAAATVADWDDLEEALLADPEVDDVGAEMPLLATAGGFGPGQDINSSWSGVQALYAAYDMVGIEEAWRLFASTSATLIPGKPDVVVIDSGLLPVAAGNVKTDSASKNAYQANALAEQVDRLLTDLVVGGTDPNPGASQADTRADWVTPGAHWYSARSGSGGSIDLAAPADVLGVRATSATHATFGRSWGTSYATALVSGVAAMLKAADPDLRGSDLAGIIQGTATPITVLWDPPEPMQRLDAAAALAYVLSRDGTLDQDVRVYAGDYSSSRIWYQSYDLAVRQFVGAADSYNASGHCQPVDVEVDHRGDLIYALCYNGSAAASLLVLAHGASGELAKVGQTTLPGAVDLNTELVATPEGYVVIATDASAGSGAASFTVLDSFDGSVITQDQALLPGSVVELEGAAGHRTGEQVYFTANDNDGTVGGDQLAIVDLDTFYRSTGGITVTSGDYDAADNPVQVRDIDFDPVDELPISLFTHSISDSEVVWIDTDGSYIEDEEVDSIDNGQTLAINPSGQDRLAWLGSIDPGTPWFSMVDVTDSPWSPLAVVAAPGSLTSPSAAFADVSDTGRSVLLGWRASGSTLSVYVVPHDPTLSSTTSDPTLVTDIANYDVMGAFISSLRGVAMTPSISVLSPRPGKELSGMRRLLVQVRDPDIQRLSFQIDGATVPTCPDDVGLADGISDACILPAVGWTGTSDHRVEITAHFTDDTTAITQVRY